MLKFQDNTVIVIGTGDDLKLYHDGSNSYIQHGTTGNLRYQSGNHDFYNQAGDEFLCRMIQDDAVSLYYNGTAMFQTASYGTLQNNGNFRLADGTDADAGWGRIQWGASQDLEIYHNATDSIIKNSTNALKLDSGRTILRNLSNSDPMVDCTGGAAVELFHDGTKKLETSTEGAVITSTFQGTGGPGILKLQTSGGATNQEFLACYYNNTTLAGGLRRNGTGQNVELFQGSDSRLKKDIVGMPAVLSKLNQIKLKSYKYKDDNSATGSGPLAQELVSIFPEKVAKTDDGTGDTIPSGVDPWTVGKDFTWELIKAVQELSAQNTALEARIATLEAN